MGRCLLLVLLLALIEQTPQPTFEVADIKPSDPSNPTPRAKGRVLPGGRIELPGATLKELIMFAYGVQEDMISGGPGWATRDRYWEVGFVTSWVQEASRRNPMPAAPIRAVQKDAFPPVHLLLPGGRKALLFSFEAINARELRESRILASAEGLDAGTG